MLLLLKCVDGVDAAIAHIAQYGSQHTDCIVTECIATAGIFMRHVDSAIVMHNASTQFADGGEFGFGAESELGQVSCTRAGQSGSSN